MHTAKIDHPSAPIFGILSLILAPFAVLIVVYFASGTSWGFSQPRRVIVFAQCLLLFLLGSGLTSDIAGVVRCEQPRWLSINGLLVTIRITGAISLFFIRWMIEFR
jgi:hypothetical protein